jgi:hypothetical protein
LSLSDLRVILFEWIKGEGQMKLQVAFREFNQQFGGHNVLCALGVVEGKPAELDIYEDRFVNFRLAFDGASGLLSTVTCLDNPHPITEGFGAANDEHLLHVCDLESLQASSLRRTHPNDYQNAEFALRMTDVEPSMDGRVVYAFAGLVYADENQKIDVSKLYQVESLQQSATAPMFLSGIVGATLRRELGEVNVETAMRGDALSGFLRKPWWGFGDEPVALPGTMRRSVYHNHQRYLDLAFKDRTVEEAAEFSTLRSEMKVVGFDTIESDPVFARYVHERMKLGLKAHVPEKRSVVLAREPALASLVRSLINEEVTGLKI